MFDKKPVLILLGIILLFSTAITFVLIFKSNKNQVDPNIDNDPNIVNRPRTGGLILDTTRMASIGTDFIGYYTNFNNETLQDGTWYNKISEFIDEEVLKEIPNSQLFQRIYDNEWKLTRILNPKTINVLISIDKIETSDSLEHNAYIYIYVVERKNGAEVIDSPYFDFINTFSTKYLIYFTQDYKISYVDIENSVLIKSDRDYRNS